MLPIDKIKLVFDGHGEVMRTVDLSASKIYYADIQKLIREGVIEKIRYGYYQWIDHENPSEVTAVTGLFPDGIFCMNTALFYYGYSDRTPLEWHIAVSKDSGKSRFNVDYPFVKPYYIEPAVLEIGQTRVKMDGRQVRIYDKERVICDCLRYAKKMDKEIFNKAIQAYVNDTGKNISRLMEYAKKLRVEKKVKDLIGVWL
ncbi:type IV toxin-antitoxin system AbiEi family antitoxin domain-containing protein [Desulfitobacterium sp.]|uniref:type IV toxin-antitoxin system AbiEi family antitoxin domain-containing protein n=1 Tax=Desulfitobacterium sp. TaxID=49981 RepID=UPI002C27FD24|nr:type IV toxin-antitoxin system AbiEi family antitoxin domain-containing protein [Desulfitobacterium sp.]HVJ49950.1 type IV toxin-antitoxin system AbiEi family antitoxin domain-containing protein [Desulfitobacterium sp.]